jgi:hypothetical protein
MYNFKDWLKIYICQSRNGFQGTKEVDSKENKGRG